MELTFEWVEEKDLLNRKKHGVRFEQAKTVFNDPRSITILDEARSDEEERYLDLVISSHGRLLVVFYTEREPNIRIIRCRRATRSERKAYEQADYVAENGRDAA